MNKRLLAVANEAVQAWIIELIVVHGSAGGDVSWNPMKNGQKLVDGVTSELYYLYHERDAAVDAFMATAYE